MSALRETYRDFIINYDPPPIPVRCCDWQFWHKDFDGAPNNPGEGPGDNRCGSAGSLDDAKLEIDMILEDWS